jgi:hypothetical protein
MIQNQDARLNPTLWKTCSPDINTQCKYEMLDFQNLDQEFNGRILKCLKNLFLKNSLSIQCRLEIDEIMREAANVDYRLDPLLTEACLTELQQFCSDVPNDKKEDCLRLAFHKQKIIRGSKCFDV